MPIRSARPADAAAISRVRVACWQATYAGIIPDTFLTPQFISQFVERRQRMLIGREYEEVCFVVEEPPEGILGYAVGGFALDGNSSYSGELYEVYVLPHAQKLGLGRQLTLCVARELMAQGYPSMRLYVLAENQHARRFYERLGGTVIEERTVELEGIPVRDVAYGWTEIRQIPGIQGE